jgi:hypothetical protein
MTRKIWVRHVDVGREIRGLSVVRGRRARLGPAALPDEVRTAVAAACRQIVDDLGSADADPALNPGQPRPTQPTAATPSPLPLPRILAIDLPERLVP